jgi:PAS domain S-box-containing protein
MTRTSQTGGLPLPHRILVLAPHGRDARLVVEVLEHQGHGAVACATMSQLAARLGEHAGAAILAQEALDRPAMETLGRALAEQPGWSELPLIVLTRDTVEGRATWQRVAELSAIRHATLLERPLRALTLVSAVRVALRSRERQYQLRDQIAERGRREARLAESEQRFRRLADAAPVLIWMTDETGRCTYCNAAWLDHTGREASDVIGTGWQQDIHPEDREHVALVTEDALHRGESFSLEFRLRRHDGEHHWFLAHAVPRVPNRETPHGYIGSAIDITQRKRDEESRKLLLRELNHRVKNTLALVSSLAAQTLRSTRDPEQFHDAFTGRLRALAATHTLLSRSQWSGASLTDLVGAAFSPYGSLDSERLNVAGDPFELEPREALALGLVLHELATNAAKYGSLSAAEGRVSVSWRRTGADGLLSLVWEESGGPPVEPPAQTGFGTRMIERSTSYELGGRCTFDYAPTGLRCEIEFNCARPAEST